MRGSVGQAVAQPIGEPGEDAQLLRVQPGDHELVHVAVEVLRDALLQVLAVLGEPDAQAAQVLGMSQSAVSQTLQRLETAMDRTLVRRKGRSFSLTPWVRRCWPMSRRCRSRPNASGCASASTGPNFG